MAYNKENYLNRVLEIQKIVLKEKEKGVKMKDTYNNFIYPKYLISYSTFNNYMTINTVMERKKAITTCSVTAQKKSIFTD